MIRFYVYTCERKGAKPFRGVGSIWGECWFGNVQSPLSFQEGFCWEARVVLNHPFKLDSLEKKNLAVSNSFGQWKRQKD